MPKYAVLCFLIVSLLLAGCGSAKTSEPTVSPTAPKPSEELVIVGQLIHIDKTPACGTGLWGAVAEYSVVTVQSGTYSEKTIHVVHGCPEIMRGEYIEGSGSLVSFQINDYHMLELTKQNVYDVTVYPGETEFSVDSIYFCKKVDPYNQK